MIYRKKHLPDIEQWSQISGSNVIPGRARPGLAGLGPHTNCLQDAEKRGFYVECWEASRMEAERDLKKLRREVVPRPETLNPEP